MLPGFLKTALKSVIANFSYWLSYVLSIILKYCLQKNINPNYLSDMSHPKEMKIIQDLYDDIISPVALLSPHLACKYKVETSI